MRFLNPLRMKSLLPPFFLLHFHWRHTEEYTACYIQRIFPPPCWSTEGSSLCPYRSPDMLVLLYLSHCWQTLLPTDSNFVLHFHRNTNFWDFTCKKLKSYLLDIKMTQICTCVGSWESFFFVYAYLPQYYNSVFGVISRKRFINWFTKPPLVVKAGCTLLYDNRCLMPLEKTQIVQDLSTTWEKPFKNHFM